MLKKLAYFTGWLLVLSLLMLFCFTLGLWQNWSTPTILLFWLLMLSLAILFWSAIYALTRAIKGKQGRRWLEKYRLSRREYVLLSNWKRGASVLKRIRSRRAQLPWYLLIGDRCGKSTLLASAGLPRFDDASDDSIVGPTRTLRWWFFRQLCVLDLSSNFLNSSATFRQGWEKVTQWCARMPAPSGIIVALPVSALMNDDLSALHTLVRQQRMLIEPLVRRFGERLPLYVMVTQCDRFPGFSLWHQQLSVTQRQQPLGYTWQTPPHIDGQDMLALQGLFAALKLGMSHIRLSMTPTEALSAQESAILLDFPESFATLEPKLRYALAALCEPNAYFSHTSLNSVWFSATELNPENRGRRAGVFIHDLLTRHLRDLSLRRGSLRWYQRPRGKIACTTALAVAAVWIVVSAFLSFVRLQPEVSLLLPNTLAIFLEQDEHYSPTALRYLPFQLLLKKQHQQAESQLVSVASTPRLPLTTLMALQQQALTAEPEQYRSLILQLSHAVFIWQQMRDNASLEMLSQEPSISPTYRQRNYPDSLSPLAILALERYYMQRSDGELWLQTARRVLTMLVNHDPKLNWLVAPSPTLPALQATVVWPSLPNSIALSGIWTLVGESTLNDWMTQIESTIGQQPLFQQARELRPMQRQNAWKQYLIDITASLGASAPVTLSHGQLIAIGQNESKAMQFVDRALDELKDIPPAQAQPWLNTMRELQRLAVNGNTSTLLSNATKVDNRLRKSLTAWLHGTPPEMRNNAPPSFQTWQQWHIARSSAVKEAVAQVKPNLQLTRELFSPEQGTSGHNPLTGLFPALTALQERISPQNNDASIAAVWLLYKDDARRLLGNAIAQSSCWLNDQWKNTVIWPLNKNSEQLSHEEQQIQNQHSVSAFLRGPAKDLLISNGSSFAAADYAGMKVLLTDDFIRFSNREFSPEILQDVPQRASTRENDRRTVLKEKLNALTMKQSELEKKSWKTSITSQPATVPGGATLIPTGTELTLNCLNGNQHLKSMNFSEKQEFIWIPGQCPDMTLNVIFPDFTASYQLHGDDAWPWFINLFTEGEVLLDNSDFGDSAGLLLQMGIKQILVRFSVSDPQEIETAWESWIEIDNSINDLNVQIASLDERIGSPSFQPISALPDNAAQCQ